MEQQRRTLKRKKYNSQTRKIQVLAVLAVLIAAALLCMGIFLWGRHGPRTPYDPNAVDSSQKPLMEGDMLKMLQDAADESAFRVKMNSEVEVSYSGSQQTADWDIINSIENSCNMQVTITGEDGAVLFESRILRPGEQELTGALQRKMAPGTYNAEALARAMDPESGEVLGNVTAEIILNVQ